MISGEFRCGVCNKRLFDVKNLKINPEGSIEILGRCKHLNTLRACDLTPNRIK